MESGEIESILDANGLLPFLQVVKEAARLKLPRGACSYIIEFEIGERADHLEVPEEYTFLALLESKDTDQEASDCLRALGEYFGLSNFFLDLRKSIVTAQASDPDSFRCCDTHADLLVEKMAAGELLADNISLRLFMRVMKNFADMSRYI